MSANGELFITETLSDTLINNDMINYDCEKLIVPKGYYEMWSDRSIPTTDEIKIDGSDDVVTFEIEKVYGEEYGEEYCDIYLSKLTRGNKTILINREGEVWSGQVDFIEYLNPIIADVKDGEEGNLDKSTVDGLMKVIRAKIEFHEGLIDEDEYEIQIALAYE